ncbi:MAG: glycosyltransferase family 1 protein [Bacteroidaceae bacterium]|nr:glycosyltransferase family 1 protein [Bacteroidaceae bacterium]
MKILLVGEYSNVHWALAEGLKALGHKATVLSDGDHWKGYQRDIDLRRRSLGRIDTLRYLFDLKRTWPRLCDYDVVQLINPVFLDLRAERILPYYEKLRKRNGRMFLGSFGIDKPWVEEGLKPDTFRYSDFYLFGQRRHNSFTAEMEADWMGPKGELFDTIAHDCDGIIAGLYENYRCCQPKYAEKLHFIPFPVSSPSHPSPRTSHPSPLTFFIGIQRKRSEYKGTDIMLRALEKLHAKYPTQMRVVKAESVPFAQYQKMMDESQVLLDQLYSYTPAMNGLLAMSKGLVLVGGAEPEHYDLLGEHELQPIINVQPTEEDVFLQIEKRLLQHPDDIRQLSLDSQRYVRRHHDPIRVAERYLSVWGL